MKPWLMCADQKGASEDLQYFHPKCGRVYCMACLDKHNKHSTNCRQMGQSFSDIRSKFQIAIACALLLSMHIFIACIGV